MGSRCENCKFCQHFLEKPETLLGRLWKWHTTWCPAWKRYQKELAEKDKRQNAKDEKPEGA
jgi:hypothetical protein